MYIYIIEMFEKVIAVWYMQWILIHTPDTFSLCFASKKKDIYQSAIELATLHSFYIFDWLSSNNIFLGKE